MRRPGFLAAESGGVSVVTAASAVAIIGFTGLAVDIGAVFLESRRLQGTADLAAITASQNLTRAHALAVATVNDNGWSDPEVRTTLGVYTPDREIPPPQRFRANAPRPNAVNVEVTTEAPLYFGRLFIPEGQMTIRRRATAANTREAAFQVGSRLLSLRGGIANDALSAGSEVNLSVMDYNALLRADVELFEYVEALRTRLELEAASFDSTLNHRAESGDALDAIADVLAASDPRAEQAMRTLARAANRSGRELELGDVIDLGPRGAQDHVTAAGGSRIEIGAMDLASAILEVAGGARQVRLDLDAAVPGLADTNVWLAIGERPNESGWLALTSDSDVTIRTAQTRLYVVASVNAAGLAGVRVPILIELASAQARLVDVECDADPARRGATLEVAPSIGSFSLGEVDTADLDNFRRELRPTPAQVLRTPLARVEASSLITVGGARWQSTRFSHADIQQGRVKSVATRDAARATISSLLSNAELTLSGPGGRGLPIGAGALTPAVREALTRAAAPLDDLINGLSDLLGVRLGEADVRVNGVRCGAGLVA